MYKQRNFLISTVKAHILRLFSMMLSFYKWKVSFRIFRHCGLHWTIVRAMELVHKFLCWFHWYWKIIYQLILESWKIIWKIHFEFISSIHQRIQMKKDQCSNNWQSNANLKNTKKHLQWLRLFQIVFVQYYRKEQSIFILNTIYWINITSTECLFDFRFVCMRYNCIEIYIE